MTLPYSDIALPGLDAKQVLHNTFSYIYIFFFISRRQRAHHHPRFSVRGEMRPQQGRFYLQGLHRRLHGGETALLAALRRHDRSRGQFADRRA